jgi:hypothetical protein
MVSTWRPASEAEAAGALAAFVEWLRATGALVDAGPDRARTGFDAALRRFMGWTDGPAPARADGKEALVLHRGGRTSWRYDGLPGWALDRLAGADALDLVRFHLFEAETRPDDRVLWLGSPDDPLPLGALYVGATVILAEPHDPRLAGPEQARVIRPRSERAATPPP